jgi:hypothetical protein
LTPLKIGDVTIAELEDDVAELLVGLASGGPSEGADCVSFSVRREIQQQEERSGPWVYYQNYTPITVSFELKFTEVREGRRVA